MPLIIGMEKNEIHVYYGKTEVTVEKTAKATITNGEDIIYTITVTNKGFIPATGVTVTDILPEELEQIEEISDKGSLNADKTKIIWNIDIPANNGKTPGVKTLTVKAKTKKSTIGKTIKNEVELGGTEQGSSTCTTNVNKKKINITEVTEGKDAENVNIIFLMDNSSSMNEPIIGKSYSNNGANHVAPSDMNKTRIYSAKQATSEFINNIYSDAKMKDTNMAVITFNKSGEESTTNVEITGKGPYDEIYREKRKYYVIEQDGTKTEIDIDDYEKATDGKYYEIKKQSISTGAHEVGRATSTNWTDLKNQVEKITIGNRRDGLGTNISPALKKAKTIISEYKEQNNNRNIVIVLGDGAINDTYTNSLNSLKGADGADAIYSIGFGADAANENKTAYKQLAKISTNNKVYTAQNTQELIKQFLSILEDIKPNGEQTTGESTLIKDIKPGEIAFKLSKDLKISATTPLIITNNNNEVIKCTKQTELIEYGIRYDATNKIIRWDLNECLEKNSALDLSGTLKLKYYIPLN